MMSMKRVALATGIEMNVALAGPEEAPPVILLHGFPESHRTWRAVAPLLSDRLRLVMPDQRGFGDSDRPQEIEAYKTDTLLEDVMALADSLSIERFALVGHDWGGAIAWAAAIRREPRLNRLAIINSPHPYIFQKSLVEDAEQRQASQYMRAFRQPGFEKFVEAMGFEAFFDKSFRPHVDLSIISKEERATYIAQWERPGALTAMLNWYRASKMVVPPPGITVDLPDVPIAAAKIQVPVRVIWGLEDKALLPVQLNGIGEVAEDLELFALKGVGHFAPWEAPRQVADALKPFLLEA
ncbi:MAG: alpha/beta hydrolase [Sphingomonas sp.]|nr:alpha/beta hydrolase [Sphingomonas sp.]